MHKEVISKSFHSHAEEYDQHVAVQKRVVENLAGLASAHVTGMPAAILDVGCGTGQLLDMLQRIYPLSARFGVDLAFNMLHCAACRSADRPFLVAGDAEALPFVHGSFDLLVSTSMLQWLDSLDLFLSEAHRVIAPGGSVCIAFFMGDTFQELQESVQAAMQSQHIAGRGAEQRLHRFQNREMIERSLAASPFNDINVIYGRETEMYADMYQLLRTTKKIGAGASSGSGGAVGLRWRGILNEAAGLYRTRYGVNGHVPATYEVCYVVASRAR